MHHSKVSTASFSALTLCLVGAALSARAASVAVASSSSTSVEVVYILAGSSLVTYDVDRSTGAPTEEGSGITLDSASNTILVPSPNDHFVYVTGNDGQGVEWLWVYATDPTGVPQLPAVQALDLTDKNFVTYDFAIDANGTLAYAAETASTSQYYTLAKIAKFTIDPSTGIVTKAAKPAASSPINGPCLLSASALFYLYGLNPNGTVMYDYWDCNYPFANSSAMYYKRTVNQSTGAISPDKQIFSWGDGNEGTDVVNITPSALIYFSVPSPGAMSSVNVYSLNGTSLFSCSASMLEACGFGTWNYTDVTGNYDLILLSPGVTQITKMEFGTKQIVDTSYFVPGNFLAFAPDDALIYSQNNTYSPWLYPIYVFDPGSGVLTYNGGEITNYNGGTFIPALRQ